MLHIVFEQLKNELIKGATKKEHPFRFFTLATVDENNCPQQRTVVLRKVDPDLTLYFYTDKRSAKIQHLQYNSSISALFYHPKQLVQLKMEGIGSIIKEQATIRSLWQQIPLNSRKEYTVNATPGDPLHNPDALTYLSTEHFFGVVEIKTHKVEYLRLGHPHHTRTMFTKAGNDWKGSFLVP
ncbi:MAG: pyridoxamine 5'-phosphate oxidase family protein [Bacteroidota bacterium]